MSIEILPQQASCGAIIRGIDLRLELSPADVAAVRSAWLKHQVIAFPGQPLEIADIERFATYMGPNGEDPYIEAIAGHPRVVRSSVNRMKKLQSLQKPGIRIGVS
jgi:taurine dioxygenase